jgi:hypothetical protein
MLLVSLAVHLRDCVKNQQVSTVDHLRHPSPFSSLIRSNPLLVTLIGNPKSVQWYYPSSLHLRVRVGWHSYFPSPLSVWPISGLFSWTVNMFFIRFLTRFQRYGRIFELYVTHPNPTMHPGVLRRAPNLFRYPFQVSPISPHFIYFAFLSQH